mgnify:CR=1 FL=1
MDLTLLNLKIMVKKTGLWRGLSGLCAALARGASLGDACMAGAKVSSFVVADEKNIYSGPPLKELSDV